MTSVIIFSILSFLLGIIVNLVSYRFRVKSEYSIINKIDEILPQIQCAQCGYPSCYAYSSAIINKNESIYKCIPGGRETISKLETLLNTDRSQYDIFMHLQENSICSIVEIDENNCVGCSKCRLICPVDAIIGTYNFRHTVLVDYCTGCNLCIPVCPTSCIIEKNSIS